jgi:iron complex outermembrane receptor protein
LAQTSTRESAVQDWLPLMPADRYQYGIKWTFKEGEKAAQTPSFVRISGTSVQRQIRIPDAGLTKPAPAKYTVLTLDAGHTFNLGKHPLELGFSVQNLLNTRYRDYLNFFRFYADELGANVGVRAKWRFGSTL